MRQPSAETGPMTTPTNGPPPIEALRAALADQLHMGIEHLPCADRYADDLPTWQAEVARCHDNVDRWLLAHPGDQPVRGGLIQYEMGESFSLAAHSMGRNLAGELLDVTLEREVSPRRFIEHPAAIGFFFCTAMWTITPSHGHGELGGSIDS